MKVILILLAALASVYAVGCGGVERARPRARLRVITVPSHARVYIDDHYAGSGRILAARPIVLAPGAHLVTVQATGHFPHDLELQLAPGLTTARVALRPVPP